jgi:hypothetical protein
MPSVQIRSNQELDALAQTIRSAAQHASRSLRDILAREDDGLQVLRMMKFAGIGRHPTEDRDLNIIEQVNQTFTYLASVEAARRMLQQHPDSGGLQLNLGTHRGFDIESLSPRLVAAEVFAATHPNSNDKVRKDVKRLVEQASDVAHRYVFFSCPEFKTLSRQPAFEREGVEVWSLPTAQLVRALS